MLGVWGPTGYNGGQWLQLGWALAITCFKENIVNHFRKLFLGKIYIWEVADFPSWGSCHLGNYHLGKCTFGKLLLEKLYIWEVATWENTLGKRPVEKYLASKSTHCLSFTTYIIFVCKIVSLSKYVVLRDFTT